MNNQTKIEKRRAYDREWKRKKYLENPEKLRAKGREEYRKIKENPEKLKKFKEYRRKYNREYSKTEKRKAWRRKYAREMTKEQTKRIYQQRRKRPYERLASVIRSRINDVLKHGYKSDRTEKLIGITIKELKKYIENQFRDSMTWDNYGYYGWHIDHILPLSSFDLTKAEEQKKAFHYTNLQPLWAKENMHKHSKILN